MGQRLGLHEMLCNALASLGVWLWDPFNFDEDNLPDAIATEARKHVYFEPPEGFKMSYPCIVYGREAIDTKFASNMPYSHQKRYTVKVIDQDPESIIPDAIADLPKCSFDRHFVSDNLHHDVFTIYY